MVSRPVAGLDKVDCRILKRLNDGSEAPGPTVRSRINKLVKFGFVEEKSFGEFGITMRGQLELARWRFRKLPKSRYSVSGASTDRILFEKIFKSSQST